MCSGSGVPRAEYREEWILGVCFFGRGPGSMVVVSGAWRRAMRSLSVSDSAAVGYQSR